MGRRKVIEVYYEDIGNLTELLAKLVNSYRLLIGGAAELNIIALSRKSEVKAALRRAYNLGEVIDRLIHRLEDINLNYLEYCTLKADILKVKLEMEYIQTEIDEELKLEN
jgi:hypothetical protein